MTVKELYEWAKKNEVLNAPIAVNRYKDFYDGYVVDFDIDITVEEKIKTKDKYIVMWTD